MIRKNKGTVMNKMMIGNMPPEAPIPEHGPIPFRQDKKVLISG
jgi:hypothetical protein